MTRNKRNNGQILKRFFFIFSVFICSFSTYAQRIQQDIFDDLIYQSDHYTAKLKKNIFDDLTFSDSNSNKIDFNKAYLNKKFGNMLNQAEVKSMFFQDLIMDYMHIKGYEASYKVDFLDRLTITDNQGKEVVMKEDIFGNLQIEGQTKAGKTSITTSLSGDLTFRSTNATASLTKKLNGTRLYTDSNKTRIELEPVIWSQLVKRFKTEQEAFAYLLQVFFIADF